MNRTQYYKQSNSKTDQLTRPKTDRTDQSSAVSFRNATSCPSVHLTVQNKIAELKAFRQEPRSIDLVISGRWIACQLILSHAHRTVNLAIKYKVYTGNYLETRKLPFRRAGNPQKSLWNTKN